MIYGISSVLARFINYLLVPFHTGVFATATYGVVSLVYVAIAFLNVIFTFGMESAYLRYAEDRDKWASIFKTVQMSLMGFASALVFILWLLKPVLLPLMNLDPAMSDIYLMMLGILWFDTLSIVPFAELRLVRRSVLFATLRVLHVIINVALNFYLILSLGMGIEAVFLANLIATVLVTILVWGCTAKGWRGDWNADVLKRALNFGWPFVLSGIGFVINEMLDRHFLNTMDPATAIELYGIETTPEDIVGIYSACYKLAVFMLLLVQMFRMAWQPFFMRHFRDKSSPLLFGQTFIWFNGFSAILYMIVALFKKQIVALEVPVLGRTIIDSNYWGGLEIVPFLLLAYWFHGWYINFSSGVFIKEKTRVLYKITMLGATITIAANLLLIPHFGMTGSAIATLLSYGTMATVLGLYSKRIMEVPYRLPESFGFMGIIAALVFVEPFVSVWLDAGWLISKGLILTTGIIVSILYLKVLTVRNDEF